MEKKLKNRIEVENILEFKKCLYDYTNTNIETGKLLERKDKGEDVDKLIHFANFITNELRNKLINMYESNICDENEVQ